MASTVRAIPIFLASLLGLFVLATGLPVPTFAAEPPSFLLKWGSAGSGDGQFSSPRGIATDSADTVYVSDTNNDRIQKFTSTGTYLTKWGSSGSGDGQFNNPTGIATDAAGNVYVADEGNNRIQKFTSTGTYLTKWGSGGSGDGQFSFPFGVATHDDTVYVADRGNNRIQKFTSTGTYLAKWGSSGAGDGQFNNPRGVATDVAGNVYVADQSAHRMQKFSGMGTYLTQWGSFGSGNGQFGFPFGAVIDFAGDVYVADRNNFRIQKFTDTGAYLTQWGSSGSGDGQFNTPEGAATDPAGNIYVVDSGNNRIQKFGPPFVDIGAGLTGVDFSSVAWGDYDNDGDLDILLTGLEGISTRIAKVYRNTAGVFTDISAGLNAVDFSSVAWGDYDNDGDLDILLTGRHGSNTPIAVVYQNNAGVFTDIGAGLTGIFASSSVAWGDYDNDGDLDILLTGRDVGSTPFTAVYQDSAGVFTDIGAGITGVEFSSVAWGDYDNDGDLDILLTGWDGVNPVGKVYQNSAGVFTDITAIADSLTAVWESSVAWGDYDNDGDLDILLTGEDGLGNQIAQVYQNSAGVFTDIGAGLTGVDFSSVAWGDYDNDGDLDILLTGWDGVNPVTKVYQNSAGVFTDIGAGLTAAWESSVAWGDYDNDGDLDILLTGDDGSGNQIAKVYQNQIPTPNTVPAAPTNLSATRTGSGVTFAWDAATDSETPSTGLSYNLIVGTSSGSPDLLSPMANAVSGYRRVVALGSVNERTTWTIDPLPAAKLYWSVQAVDAAFSGSPFATEQCVIEACTVVDNGDFMAGRVIGSMPTASVDNWSLLTGTPQVVDDGCDDQGAIQMWGNLVVGESTKQLLPGAGFEAGKLYNVTVCYRRILTNQIPYVGFRLTASGSNPSGYPPVSGNDLIGVTPYTSSTSWITYTFQHWLAPSNASWITINPENDSSVNDGAYITWGQIDNICIEELSVTGVEDEGTTPAVMLLRAFPNPSSGRTQIRYALSEEGAATLKVFDLRGRLIQTLLDSENLAPGEYTTAWDGRNDDGGSVASGIYFYRLETATETRVHKTLIIR